jgi:hypothetical protein
MEENLSLKSGVGKRLVACLADVKRNDFLYGTGIVSERYTLFFSGPDGNDSIELLDASLNVKILTEMLLKNGAVLTGRKKENMELLFTSRDLKELIENYNFEGLDLYMSNEKSYWLSSVSYDNYMQYTLVNAVFTTSNSRFMLSVVFKNNEAPYIKRVYNFLNLLHGIEVKPRHNMGPVFNSDNINQLFSELGQYEPRFKKGSVYKLDSVFNSNNELYLEYTDISTAEKKVTRIACYEDNSNTPSERWISSVQNFFGKYKGKYFVSAKDLWDCELDYMKVPSSEGPFVFMFSGEIRESDLKEALQMMRRDAEINAKKWNNVTYNSFFSMGIKYYPDSVP